MSTSNLLERLPRELRYQIYDYVYRSNDPPDPPFHDLVDHLPVDPFLRPLPNLHGANALTRAYPQLRQEILKEFRRHCTKLVYHVRYDAKWVPPCGGAKYLNLSEVEILIEPRFGRVNTCASMLRANLQKCVEFLNENLRYVSVLRVETLDMKTGWDMEICNAVRDGREEKHESESESDTVYSYVLAPLRGLRTKVLEVTIGVPLGLDWGDIEPFDRLRFALARDLMREAEREAAQLRSR